MEGGCAPGPKKPVEKECTTFEHQGKEICVCNEPMCNGVEIQQPTTTITTTTTTKNSPQQNNGNGNRNGVSKPQSSIIVTAVLITFVLSFLY